MTSVAPLPLKGAAVTYPLYYLTKNIAEIYLDFEHPTLENAIKYVS